MTALAVAAGAILLAFVLVVIGGIISKGAIFMASAIEQVGQALAGAHSAAFEQLEADIQLAATQLATKDATIATLTAQVADLTAQLAAAAPVGTSDADLVALDGLIKPALDPVAPAATATPVTVPDNPPPAAATAGPAVANTPAVS